MPPRRIFDLKKKKKKTGSPATREVPNGPGVKNLPFNAGDVSLIPGQGTKISYATGQLNLCAAITEPMCSRVHMP